MAGRGVAGRPRRRRSRAPALPAAWRPAPLLPDATTVPVLPSLEEVFSTNIPTHKFPPKAVRGDLARVLNTLWGQLADHPDQEHLWTLDFMFWKVILRADRGPKIGDALSLTRVIRGRLHRWRAGEFAELWEEAVRSVGPQPRRRGRPRRQAEEVDELTQLRMKNAKKACTLAQEGQYTRATKALTSAGLAEQSRRNIDLMKEKHPPAARPIEEADIPTTDVPQVSISSNQVMAAVESFRRGSAPGPSGLRPEHLKGVLMAAPNRRDGAIVALTRLVNTMVSGKVPAAVTPYVCGARLIGANKKCGGLRPIAIGNILRRLVAKCVASTLYERVASYLAPHQLGVGVPGGCEKIVHSVRKAVEDDPNLYVLQGDYRNAYNMADRLTGLREMERLFPEALAWSNTCYAAPSILQYGDLQISSESGWQQGDPMSSILYALGSHEVVLKVVEEVPDLVVNAWYQDDSTQVGTLEQLTRVVDILEREGPPRGLHLSTARTVGPQDKPKSTIWSPGAVGEEREADPLGKGIPRIREGGITLLGAPVGTPEFVEGKLEDLVDKVMRVMNLLSDLSDPHTEFVILRSCISLPKVMHALRSCDTTPHTAVLQRFDRLLRTAASRIMGPPLTDTQWEQAKLPVGMGGLGLMAAEDHAAAAYASSLLSSHPTVSTILHLPEEELPDLRPPVLDSLSTRMGEEATIESLTGLTQHAISLAINLQNLRLLSDFYTREGSARDVARLASLGLKHAGDWLNLVPCPALGLHLRPAEFTCAMKYRLGANIYAREGPCVACGRHSDRLGDHSLCCGSQGERIARHSSLRDELYHTAVAAALAPARETQGLIPSRTGARPADVFIPRFAGGRDAALDVTVTHPLQQGHLAGAAVTAGHSLTLAYNRKVGPPLTGTGDQCLAAGIAFIPLAVESLGGWHDVAVDTINRVAKAKARHTGDQEEVVCRRTWQKLGLLVQKGNCALFNNRVPDVDNQ